MKRLLSVLTIVLAASLTVVAVQRAESSRQVEWLYYGGDQAGTKYSPLADINDQNIARIGFAWDYHTGTRRGLEATPVVVDGVMYTSGNWGRVYALDAATGPELWTYDPQVAGQTGRSACCDTINRGVAVWKGRVYVASLDGYLHAIDARTAQRIWRVDTLPGRKPEGFRYFVNGAPLLAGDAIVIGNGGADFKGARGSIAAYSLDSGAFRWRFYTVPHDPKLGPQEQSHLERAAKTWPAHYDWSYGGGASVGRIIGTNTILSVAVAFHHFSEGGVGHIGSVIPVTLNSDYMIPTGARKLIVGLGAGVYHVAESGSGPLGFPDTQNTFGMNARIGILAPVSRTAAVAPTVSLHFANPSKLITKVTYVALQLDARFGL